MKIQLFVETLVGATVPQPTTFSAVSKPNTGAGIPDRWPWSVSFKVGCCTPSQSSVEMTQTANRRETARWERRRYIPNHTRPIAHRPAATSNANPATIDQQTGSK